MPLIFKGVDIVMYKQNAAAKFKSMANKKDWNILAFETSCDDTSAAIVRNGRIVLANVIASQIEIHNSFGGVVPEVASRKHIENIDAVIDKALSDANMTLEDIDAIAVTYGPGLIGSLLIGVQAAKTLAYMYNKPLVPVHHIAGHIYANNLTKAMKFPLIALVVTIVVMIILASIVILSFNNSNIIKDAKETKYKNELKSYAEEVASKITNEYINERGKNSTLIKEIK